MTRSFSEGSKWVCGHVDNEFPGEPISRMSMQSVHSLCLFTIHLPFCPQIHF